MMSRLISRMIQIVLPYDKKIPPILESSFKSTKIILLLIYGYPCIFCFRLYNFTVFTIKIQKLLICLCLCSFIVPALHELYIHQLTIMDTYRQNLKTDRHSTIFHFWLPSHIQYWVDSGVKCSCPSLPVWGFGVLLIIHSS